jgi:hypothetical protein
MGEARSEMSPKDKTKTVDLTRGSKGVVSAFGKLLPRKKASVAESTEEAANTFADMIAAADDRLDKIITAKQRDLEKEPDDEAYNKKAAAILADTRYYLDKLINACVEYSELKH